MHVFLYTFKVVERLKYIFLKPVMRCFCLTVLFLNHLNTLKSAVTVFYLVI